MLILLMLQALQKCTKLPHFKNLYSQSEHVHGNHGLKMSEECDFGQIACLFMVARRRCLRQSNYVGKAQAQVGLFS